MIDIEKVSFLNLVLYVDELKAHIKQLHVSSGKSISEEALKDLESVTPHDLATKFSLDELGKWQKGNEFLDITSFLHYEVYCKLIAQTFHEKNRNGKLQEHFRFIQAHITTEQLRLVEDCFGYWHSFMSLFIGAINNVQTLLVVLKNVETISAKSLGQVIPNDKNDVNSILLNANDSLSKFIRGRIESIQVLTSSSISRTRIETKLQTKLSPEEWRGILLKLVKRGYLSKDYLENPDLLLDWINFAFALTSGRILTYARDLKLKWVAAPVCIAEFIIKLIDEGWITYGDKNKSRLYEWIDNVLDYDCDSDSLRVYFRNYPKSNVKYFDISKDVNGQILFDIIHTAPKSKKHGGKRFITDKV